MLVRVARANALLVPAGAVIGIATSVLIARWLGPETYADYATLLSILSWLLLLGESGCNTGLQRYFADVGKIHARRRFYDALQWRRWGLVFVLSLGLSLLGPIWAAHASLPLERWGPLTFGLIGILAGATLHAQLATSALFANFSHARAITLASVMMVLRAVSLGLVCIYFREPVALVVALLAVACVEAGFLHWIAIKQFSDERAKLPANIVNAAQRHGLVSLVDKISTAFTGGPFIILVLAAFHTRAELAVFAVASETLQKLLAIIFLPISNLVLPILNSSRDNPDRYVRQIERLGGAVTFMATISIGAIAAAIPSALPLLFGEAYAGAVPIALLWLAPLFIEAAVRMVWGASLLTLDQRSWLLVFNVVFGAVSLLAIFIFAHADLIVVVMVAGLIRIFGSGIVLMRAARCGLLPAESRPLRILAVTVAATVISWLGQSALPSAPHLWRLSAGMGIYIVIIAVALRFLPLFPDRMHEVLRSLAGPYGPQLARLIPRYWAQK